MNQHLADRNIGKVLNRSFDMPEVHKVRLNADNRQSRYSLRTRTYSFQVFHLQNNLKNMKEFPYGTTR